LYTDDEVAEAHKDAWLESKLAVQRCNDGASKQKTRVHVLNDPLLALGVDLSAVAPTPAGTTGIDKSVVMQRRWTSTFYATTPDQNTSQKDNKTSML
jgi:hypothetical protein